MECKNFQISKVSRAINRSGREFIFERPVLNKFGEPTDETSKIKIKGLFHDARGQGMYIDKNSSDAAILVGKSSPMILCLDYNGVEKGDILEFNNKKFQANEISDITESQAIFDISLEEVQDG